MGTEPEENKKILERDWKGLTYVYIRNPYEPFTDILFNREFTEKFEYAASFPIDDVAKMAEQLSKWCMNE